MLIRELLESTINIAEQYPMLKTLNHTDRDIWTRFNQVHPEAVEKIISFLTEAASRGSNPNIHAIEEARKIFLQYASEHKLTSPKYDRLYRGMLVGDIQDGMDDDYEVIIKKGDMVKLRNNRIWYWTSDKNHALEFIDEDDPSALVSIKYNPSIVLFDLNVLPFPGGGLGGAREDELLLYPDIEEAKVERIFD
jgi:hypothetical protein